jgi:hypothetical protein
MGTQRIGKCGRREGARSTCFAVLPFPRCFARLHTWDTHKKKDRFYSKQKPSSLLELSLPPHSLSLPSIALIAIHKKKDKATFAFTFQSVDVRRTVRGAAPP